MIFDIENWLWNSTTRIAIPFNLKGLFFRHITNICCENWEILRMHNFFQVWYCDNFHEVFCLLSLSDFQLYRTKSWRRKKCYSNIAIFFSSFKGLWLRRKPYFLFLVLYPIGMMKYKKINFLINSAYMRYVVYTYESFNCMHYI